jgi:hypothetical protein
MNIIRVKPAPVMGNFIESLTAGVQDLFKPRTGSVIQTPGALKPLDMAVVSTLALAVVAVIIMKKKGVV